MPDTITYSQSFHYFCSFRVSFMYWDNFYHSCTISYLFVADNYIAQPLLIFWMKLLHQINKLARFIHLIATRNRKRSFIWRYLMSNLLFMWDQSQNIKISKFACTRGLVDRSSQKQYVHYQSYTWYRTTGQTIVIPATGIEELLP